MTEENPIGFFSDFEKIRADAKSRGLAARMTSDDGVTPEVGRVYTVSPDFNCGDRSWIDCFWEVIGRSGPNVVVKVHENYRGPMTRLFREDDRAWYPADEAFAAYQSERAEATP